jgi:hypothetical protein
MPQGELHTDPEAIRRQAMDNVPLGLCDDALMQGTVACPLDDKLRGANRHLVETLLVGIGSNWNNAVANAHSEARFKQMLSRAGQTRSPTCYWVSRWDGSAAPSSVRP